MDIDPSLVVGYLLAWGAAKVRRIGRRADAEVDHVVDAALDRVHEVVVAKLGTESALERLTAESQTEVVSDRTKQRVALAIEDAIEYDEEFAARLSDALRQLEDSSPAVKEAIVNGNGIAAGGNLAINALGAGSVAAGVIHGSVTPGNPSRPGPEKN